MSSVSILTFTSPRIFTCACSSFTSKVFNKNTLCLESLLKSESERTQSLACMSSLSLLQLSCSECASRLCRQERLPFCEATLPKYECFCLHPQLQIGAKEKSRVKEPLAPLTLTFLPSRLTVYVFRNLNSSRYFWEPHKKHLSTRRLTAFLLRSFLQHPCVQ